MRIIRIIFQTIWHSVIVALFTVLSQVGGVIYLLHRVLYHFYPVRIQLRVLRLLHFIVLYSLASALIIPALARIGGRSPLPWRSTGQLRPAVILTCILNRHYVRHELGQSARSVAQRMHDDFEGTVVHYLDAGFPFIDGFPLWPHLSHHDGRKLDLAFCYADRRTLATTNRLPSWFGYGVCEEPRKDEYDRPAECAAKGFWQYSILKRVTPQLAKRTLMFDEKRTKALIQGFVDLPAIDKILLEPHLTKRLQLGSPKMRVHGCIAVRHDDHVHVELRK